MGKGRRSARMPAWCHCTRFCCRRGSGLAGRREEAGMTRRCPDCRGPNSGCKGWSGWSHTAGSGTPDSAICRTSSKRCECREAWQAGGPRFKSPREEKKKVSGDCWGCSSVSSLRTNQRGMGGKLSGGRSALGGTAQKRRPCRSFGAT